MAIVSRDSRTVALEILEQSRAIAKIVSEKFRTTVASVSDNSRIVVEVLEQPGTIAKIVPIQSGTRTAASLVLVRAIMSSRGATQTGIAIGTVTPTIGGAGTVAVG